MGIFSRIGDVVKSNINDLIDRAEDPEKMVKQIILDLQKEVSNATTALGKAKASERIAKRQYDDAVKTSADWEMKAKAALNAGEVDLAKKALSNKVKADESVKQYQQMYEQIAAQTAQLQEQVETLEVQAGRSQEPSGNADRTLSDGKDPEESGTVGGRSEFFQCHG